MPKKKTRSEVKLEKNPITMNYRYQGQTLVSKFENEIEWVTDTKIGHIELDAIDQEVAQPNLQAPYRIIKRSGFLDPIVSPQVVQYLELMLVIAQHYDKDTRKCRDTKGNVGVDLSAEMLTMTFGIPQYEKVLQMTKEEAVTIYNKNVANNRCHINEVWLAEPRKLGLKATDNILREDFKDVPMDLIIMLNQAFGKEDYKHYHLWMFHYIHTIFIGKEYLYWA